MKCDIRDIGDRVTKLEVAQPLASSSRISTGTEKSGFEDSGSKKTPPNGTNATEKI